jgi:hypothetical protein
VTGNKAHVRQVSQGGTTAEGIHLGAIAGTVDLLQRCYSGLEAWSPQGQGGIGQKVWREQEWPEHGPKPDGLVRSTIARLSTAL